jgi:quinol monooxygenase YgiN
MAIYQTATYRVRPSGVETVKRAIEEFVEYVRANEPGTRLYQAWQGQDDPTSFLHLFIFADDEAQRIHSESEAVTRFESIYTPELVGGAVVFTDYLLVARNDAAQVAPG